MKGKDMMKQGKKWKRWQWRRGRWKKGVKKNKEKEYVQVEKDEEEKEEDEIEKQEEAGQKEEMQWLYSIVINTSPCTTPATVITPSWKNKHHKEPSSGTTFRVFIGPFPPPGTTFRVCKGHSPSGTAFRVFRGPFPPSGGVIGALFPSPETFKNSFRRNLSSVRTH